MLIQLQQQRKESLENKKHTQTCAELELVTSVIPVHTLAQCTRRTELTSQLGACSSEVQTVLAHTDIILMAQNIFRNIYSFKYSGWILPPFPTKQYVSVTEFRFDLLLLLLFNQNNALGSRHSTLGTRFLALGTWHSELGTRLSTPEVGLNVFHCL